MIRPKDENAQERTDFRMNTANRQWMCVSLHQWNAEAPIDIFNNNKKNKEKTIPMVDALIQFMLIFHLLVIYLSAIETEIALCRVYFIRVYTNYDFQTTILNS